jgi:hypothetical protein
LGLPAGEIGGLKNTTVRLNGRQHDPFSPYLLYRPTLRGLEATLRDVLVISGNAAITAALSADDLNVIPVDPAETPGWVDWASAAHLLMLDLGDADRAVDVVGELRSRSVDVPVLIVAESVSDSPRLVALRLSDHNVKTLSMPLTRDRLLRAVGRTMAAVDLAAARQEEEQQAAWDAGAPELSAAVLDGVDLLGVDLPAVDLPAVDPPAVDLPAVEVPDETSGSRVEWPSFEMESFTQSESLDWRTAFTPEALDAIDLNAPDPVLETPAATGIDWSTPSIEWSTPVTPPAAPVEPTPAPAPAPSSGPAWPSIDDFLPKTPDWSAPASSDWSTPTTTPAAPAAAPAEEPEWMKYLPSTPAPSTSSWDTAAPARPGETTEESDWMRFVPPPAATTPTAPPVPPAPEYDLPPAPETDNLKHRLAPWARPRPRSDETMPPVRPTSAPQAYYPPPAAPESYPAPESYAVPQSYETPPDYRTPDYAAPDYAAPDYATTQPYTAPPAAPMPTDPGVHLDPREARARAKNAAKAAKAAEKEAAKARLQAEKDAARMARARAEFGPGQSPVPTQPTDFNPIPGNRPDARARLTAEADRLDAARRTAEAKAAARAADEAVRAEQARFDADIRAGQEATRAAAAHAEAEARAAERAAAESAKADKAHAEAEARAAREAAKAAEIEAKHRARADGEAARAAERAAAVAAKAALQMAEADQKATEQASRAIEKARAEAARLADAQARADEKAARARAVEDAKAAEEALKHSERIAAEAARAEERARVVTERAAHAQAKVDSRLAAEAAKAARLQAEMEAHQAAIRSREDAERQRIAAKLQAEVSRVETIERVEGLIKQSKIRAEADRIVDEAVRNAEEEAEARMLANRPVYYGPELEPPGLGFVHQLMAMTDTLAAPAQVCEELAFVAMEQLECEAVAIIIPDGDAWATASGIGIGARDLRYRLSEEHWFIREVLGRERPKVCDDPEGLRDELAGVPLAAWPHLVGIPLLDANSILVAARGGEPFDREVAEVFTEYIGDYVAELAETLETRDVARQIHDARTHRRR